MFEKFRHPRGPPTSCRREKTTISIEYVSVYQRRGPRQKRAREQLGGKRDSSCRRRQASHLIAFNMMGKITLKRLMAMLLQVNPTLLLSKVTRSAPLTIKMTLSKKVSVRCQNNLHPPTPILIQFMALGSLDSLTVKIFCTLKRCSLGTLALRSKTDAI